MIVQPLIVHVLLLRVNVPVNTKLLRLFTAVMCVKVIFAVAAVNVTVLLTVFVVGLFVQVQTARHPRVWAVLLVTVNV